MCLPSCWCQNLTAGPRDRDRDRDTGAGETFTWGDLILLDASQPHQGPDIAEEDRLGLYCNIGTPNNLQKIFGGRYVTDLGVYSDALEEDPKSFEFEAPETGVRTSLQQAADAHPPQARWLSEVWHLFCDHILYRSERNHLCRGGRTLTSCQKRPP